VPSDIIGNPRAAYYDGEEGSSPFTDWVRYGDYFFADEEEMWLDYQTRPDEAKWPAYFTQLMVYALAAETADALTDEESKSARLRAIAFGPPGDEGKGGYFREARQLDAQQSPSEAIEDFSLISVRF
jgi:hypothetical protein